VISATGANDSTQEECSPGGEGNRRARALYDSCRRRSSRRAGRARRIGV